MTKSKPAPAEKFPWYPLCCEDVCPKPATYRVERADGTKLFGEWCEEHADVTVARVNDCEATTRRSRKRE